MKPFIASFLVAIIAFSASGCACKPDGPPSFWCSVQAKTIECSKEVGVSVATDLAIEVLKALRSGPDWKAAVQKLIDAGATDVLCILGNLPNVFGSKPEAGIVALNQRGKDLANASEFLNERKITVSVAAGVK